MTSIETSSSTLTRTALEPLLTVTAVCELLGISKPTLYRVINAGELATIRVGSSPRFSPDDVRDYLERSREANTS
jgi:excisionase family DNA binding protein